MRIGREGEYEPGGTERAVQGYSSSKIWAGRAIREGEEVFVAYGRGFRVGGGMVSGERSGWGVFKKRFYRDMG